MSATSGGTLYIVSAPSGAGKSSLIAQLLARFNRDDRLRLSVSHTTRPPRPGEVDHVAYHFVDETEFARLSARRAFYEEACVFGHRYGTSREIVTEWLTAGKDVLLDIDWQGARQIRAQTPGCVSVFIAPPTLAELRSRLEKRGQDSAATIAARMLKAGDELKHYREYDCLIVNADFEESLMTLRAIVVAGRARRAVAAGLPPALRDELRAAADPADAVK